MSDPAATVETLVQQGVGAFNAGDLAGAEQFFRGALAAAPGDLRAIHGIGVILSRSGRKTEAIAFLAPYVERGALVESMVRKSETPIAPFTRRRPMSVSTRPGATTFTWMPWWRSSLASVIASASRAAFAML